MKNFADIMKKAQQMQQKMTDMQKELESAEVTGAAGAGMVCQGGNLTGWRQDALRASFRSSRHRGTFP